MQIRISLGAFLEALIHLERHLEQCAGLGNIAHHKSVAGAIKATFGWISAACRKTSWAAALTIAPVMHLAVIVTGGIMAYEYHTADKAGIVRTGSVRIF